MESILEDTSLEDFIEVLQAAGIDSNDVVGALELNELFDTGSVTIYVDGTAYLLTLKIEVMPVC